MISSKAQGEEGRKSARNASEIEERTIDKSLHRQHNLNQSIVIAFWNVAKQNGHAFDPVRLK